MVTGLARADQMSRELPREPAVVLINRTPNLPERVPVLGFYALIHT